MVSACLLDFLGGIAHAFGSDTLVLHKALLDVVAIPSTLLDRMARDQPLSAGRFNAPGHKTRMLGGYLRQRAPVKGSAGIAAARTAAA
jgi:hypothetical protein